ncbi:unnamed protein product [Rotaria sp. Silwood2]|nr:unnamed protein product [Rotaria sp. Silwood2]
MKRVGIQSGQKKTAWWTEEIRNVVREKKIAYHKWIQRQTTENGQNYKQIREKVKKIVSEAKSKSWEQFGHQLEHNNHSANKLFWQTIRRLHKGEQKPTRSIKDMTGRLLTREEDILNRWKKYFAELYNPTSAKYIKLNEPTDNESNTISTTEVTTAIQSLKSGKAAGVDEIRPEMLKSLKSGGVDWLTRICRVAWTTGVQFSDDGKQAGEIDRQIGTASRILRSLNRTVITKAELSKKDKIGNLQIVVSTNTYIWT